MQWADWFKLSGLKLPSTARPSFDRGSLAVAAAADGLGIALETTRFAEVELARGELVAIDGPAFRRIERETHFLCYRKTNATVLSTVNNLLQTERVVGANTTILVNNVAGDVSAAKTGDDITVQITLPSSKASIFPRTGYLKGQLKATSTLRHQ